MVRYHFLLALVVLVAAAPAHATMMVPLDVEALTQRAEQVVVGTVESSTSHWTAGKGAIYTEVAIRVDHSMKGEADKGSLVTVRHEGGSVDGIGMRVFGAAHFTVGEEVVVFIETRAANHYIVGMAQGKMQVVRSASGKKIITRDLGGIDFVKSPTTSPAPLMPIERSLEALENQVRHFSAKPQRSAP
jgi:hypothetical protein